MNNLVSLVRHVTFHFQPTFQPGHAIHVTRDDGDVLDGRCTITVRFNAYVTIEALNEGLRTHPLLRDFAGLWITSYPRNDNEQPPAEES